MRPIRPRVGRPLKYARFLEVLEEEELYIPASIVLLGIDLGFFEAGNGIFPKIPSARALTEARLRVRHTLARFAANHGFPRLGDGFVLMTGQMPLRGWYGWRWKQAMAGVKHPTSLPVASRGPRATEGEA